MQLFPHTDETEAAELLRGIPSARLVRAALGENLRQTTLLKRLLRIAESAEREGYCDPGCACGCIE